MKKIKILYWAITGVFALMMMFSGFLYLTDEGMKQSFVQLGFPGFFRIELGLAKLIGGIALLAPLPSRLKEWVYAGFTINIISAIITHAASGHPASVLVMPILFFAALAASYFLYHKIHQPEFNTQPA